MPIENTHVYMTSALSKTEMKAITWSPLALDLIHKKEKHDPITRLMTCTQGAESVSVSSFSPINKPLSGYLGPHQSTTLPDSVVCCSAVCYRELG